MKKNRKKLTGMIIAAFLMMFFVGFFTIIKNNNNANIISPENRVNILIFGIDAQDMDHAVGTRADSIMVLSVDTSVKKPVLLSIPRDTRVTIPGRKFPEKINHAHAYGGVELLTKTVEDFLKIHIDYYAKINYKAVEELIDAIGGITLDVPLDMKYKDPYANPPLYIDINKGIQKLNGIEALHFLRFRSGYTNQDLGRIQAQQEFVNALVKELMSPLKVVKIPKLTKIFYSNIDTNITKTKLFHLGFKSLISRPNELIRITLPGKPATINGISYYVVEDNDIEQLKEKYLAKNIKDLSIARIEVLNGCGVAGVAAKFSKKLEEEKISVIYVGNYQPNNIIESFIEYHPRYKKDAKKVSKILNIKKLIEKVDETDRVDVKVIIGKDIVLSHQQQP